MALQNPTFTDEALTAFLDGEADETLRTQIEQALESDPELQARLAQLDMPLDALRAGYELDALEAPAMPAKLGKKTRSAGRSAGGLIWPTALAASFVAGLVAMRVFQPVPEPAPTPGPMQLGWVDAVAAYQALYVTETLSGTVQTEEASREIIATAEDALGLSLAPALEIEGLTFKRVQLLSLDGEPLIQMAYLDEEGVPFAFCLTPRGADDSATKTGTTFEMAKSSWVQDGVGYVLIGGQDEARVERLSEGLRAAL